MFQKAAENLVSQAWCTVLSGGSDVDVVIGQSRRGGFGAVRLRSRGGEREERREGRSAGSVTSKLALALGLVSERRDSPVALHSDPDTGLPRHP